MDRTTNSLPPLAEQISWTPVAPVAPATPTLQEQKAAQTAEVSDAKKTTVQDSSLMKKALFGTPEEQRYIATAVDQGAELSQDPTIEDLRTLDPLALAAKYGSEVAANRYRYAKAERELREFKNQERTTPQMLKDSALDVARMGVNTIGGAAVLGATARDLVLSAPSRIINAIAGEDVVGTPAPFSPMVSNAVGAVSDFLGDQQSDLMQERRQQHQLEGQIRSDDNEAQYQKQLAENAGESDVWSRAVAPWLKKQGAEFSDAAINYADDPIMAGSLVPEGVGSLIPAAAAIRTVGLARAAARLAAEGMDDVAAKAFLKTAPGREILNSEMLRAAPLVTGITESGSAINQTQQSILALPEADLMKSPAYARMREEGMSDEDARIRMAGDAGAMAGVTALPLAIAAGKISAPFAANPLKTGGIVGAARNVAAEGIEETIQEGNSQLASNLAQKAVGLDVSLDDGVAAAAAQGLLGGIAASGSLQAPGVALDAASGAISSTGKAVADGVESLQVRRQRERDAASPVGTPARAAAADQLQAAGEQILQNSPEVDPEAEPGPLTEVVTGALYVDPAKTDSMVQAYPALDAVRAASPTGTLRQSDVLEAAGSVLQDKKADPQDKIFAALDAMLALDAMRKIDNDQIREEVSRLPETDARRAGFDAGVAALPTIEGSPIQSLAEETIRQISPEIVEALAADPSPEIAKALEIISRVNAMVVPDVTYDMALAQVGSGKQADSLRRKLEAAKEAASIFRDSVAVKAQITDEQNEVLIDRPALAGKGTKTSKGTNPRLYKTHDIVRQEINLSGNSNNKLPSLAEHRRRVADASAIGRREVAQDALDELVHFAKSQVNKMTALNQSAELNQGKAGAVEFEAYGPFGKFKQAGVWFSGSNPFSVAQARDVHIDTKTTVQLAQSLASAYGLKLVERLEVPALHPRIASASITKPKQPEAQQAKAQPTKATPTAAKPKAVEPKAAEPKAEKTEDPETPTKKPAEKQITSSDQPGTATSAPSAAPTAAEVSGPEPAPVDVVAEAAAEPASTPAPEPIAEPLVVQDVDGEPETAVDAVTPWFNGLKLLLPTDENGANLLTTAFRPKPKSTSLPAYEDPAGYVLDNLDRLPEILKPEEQSAVEAHLKVSLPGFMIAFTKNMNDMMLRRDESNAALNAKAHKNKTDRPSWVAMAREGIFRDILGYETGRVLNALTELDDGTLGIEPRLLQATFMAAQEWMIQNAGRAGTVLDKERVAGMFGLPRTGHVTKAMLAQARYGTPLQSAIDAIARGIQDLVGLEANPNAPVDQTQGMFRALAVNAIEVMLQNKVLEEKELSYTIPDPNTGKPTPRDMISLRVSEMAAKDSSILNLQRIGTPFSQIFVPSQEKPRFIGTPPRDVKSTQLGNKFAEISPRAVQTINRLQKIPSRVNQPMVALVDHLGDGLFKELLGFKTITPAMEKRINKVDLERIKGKNLSIERGIRESRTYVAEAQGQPIFFRWRLSSVGRLQQEGPITPQGDKIAREILSATNAVLDLNTHEHLNAFWLAVGQSVGVSIEKMSHAEAITKTKALVAGQGALAQAVSLYRAFLENSAQPVDGSSDLEQFRAEFKAALQGSGETVTPKLLHALLTVARMELAQGKPEFGAFETALALEADGKTDGPINAMLHMGVGPFRRDELEIFAKGGLFFSKEPVSLNSFIEAEHTKHKGTPTEKPKAEDLYHLAAARLKQMLVQSGALQMAETLQTMRVLDVFLDGFTLGSPKADGGYDPEIGRNVVKNPLTVFLYGSGDAGIANKLAGAITDTFYRMLSEVAAGLVDGTMKSYRDHPLFQANPDLVSDLQKVLQVPNLDRVLSDPAGFELSLEQFAALSNQILEHFAVPMISAVDDVTGGLAANMKLTQQASQIQTLVYQELFRQALDDRDMAKAISPIASGTQTGNQPEFLPGSQLLSQSELDEAVTSMMPLAPIYRSEDQSFHIAAPERASIEKTVSVSFGGRLKSRATYLRPADASVKFSPYVTIGTGDGQMMLNIYTDADAGSDPEAAAALDRSLPVFDGVEQSLDRIKKSSAAINKAVWDGWMGSNVYRIASQGYAQMTARLTDELWAKIPDTVKREIARSMGLPKDSPLPTLRSVEHFQRKLEALADRTDDRKAALKQMAIQVDHMAGAEAPHSNPGLATDSNDPQDYDAIRDLANALQDQARTKREDQTKARQSEPKTADYAQAPNPALKAAIAKVGKTLQDFPGVIQIGGAAVLQLLNENTGMTQDQAQLLQKILTGDELFQKTVYHFGSAEELNAARAAYFPDLPRHPIDLGLTDVGTNQVWIANASAETVLHEMLHTRTMRVLEDHFAGRAVPEHVPHAVTHLERLMQEVLVLVPDSTALATLQDQLISDRLSPAAKISELISYVLTNQDLTTKTKNQNTYIALGRIVKSALAAIRRLLGLKPSDLPDTKIWNQIRFSTEVLVTGVQENTSNPGTSVLALDQTYGEDPRLARIEEKFIARLGALLDTRFQQMQAANGGRTATNQDAAYVHSEGAQLRAQGRDAAERFTAGGFRLNDREKNVFGAVHAAFSAGIRFDAALMRQVHTLHAQVLKQLSPELLTGEGLVPLDRAKAQYAFLTGADGLVRTADGRSDLLASFMALAQTSPEFREVLSTLPLPKISSELSWGSIDEAVLSLSNLVMSLLTRLSLQKPERAGNVARELDRLADAMAEIESERRMLAMLGQVSKMTDRANTYMAQHLDRASAKAVPWLEARRDQHHTRVGRIGLSVASFVAALGSKTEAAAKGEALTTMMNHVEGFDTLRSLLNDLRGATASNKDLLRMVNLVRAKVDVLRQDCREKVPETLADGFSRKLSAEEWSMLHRALGQTDLMAIGALEARALLADPGSLGTRIAAEEETLKRLAPALYDRYKTKARALAFYLDTGKTDTQNLLRNAYAIAHLFGEKDRPEPSSVGDRTIASIERLIALYGYGRQSPETQTQLKQLVETEAQGMSLVTGMLAGVRALEKEKVLPADPDATGIAVNNAWAGWIPTLQSASTQIIVQDDTKHDELRRKGWTRIGDYLGDSNEAHRGRRGYYQSSVAGRAAFRQGVAQTVHLTYSGIDLMTGKSVTGTAGVLTGARVNRLARAVANEPVGGLDNLSPDLHMLPVFNGQGEIVAYERLMDPAMLQGLKEDDHLGRMLGVWTGRILEEEAASQINRNLLETLKRIYDQAQADDREDEFVNVADKSHPDPVVRDAWRTLGFQMARTAADVFGQADFVPVRRDMVNDAIGYRAASLTDAWHEDSSRLPEGLQKAFKEWATLIPQDKAYAMIKKTEGGIQEIVSYAKTTIIVRSVVVGLNNILSNIMHLFASGVPMHKIASKGREKLLEIHEYVKNREEIGRLQIHYAAKLQDREAAQKIAMKIQALEDANGRMSIATLINAGEFSTISEGLDEADVAIREGRIVEYMEKGLSRLPGWVGTTLKNVVITKDTEIFKGLNRVIQYGDFVAKAVLYDHLLEQGMGEQQALDVIMEEFVQYNRLPGRGRDYVESMGLLWFINYTLRIQKIVFKMMRERPLSALFMMGHVGPLAGIDNVLSGSLIGKYSDGSLAFSIGPQMGMNAPTLNPVWNLTH